MIQDIYEEMGALGTSVQREMLNCTYPALYVVMFAIMEVSIVRCKRISKLLKYNSFLFRFNLRSTSSMVSNVCMFQGNTREKTWVDQQMKTVHITKENHQSLETYTKVSLYQSSINKMNE